MNILSIDTTLPTGSVALIQNRTIAFLKSWNFQKKHASEVFTALNQAVGTSKNRFENIDLIVFTSGPGSFTGIRINLSLAKAFKKILKNKIGTISTLEAFSYPYLNSGKPVITIITARKNKYYVFCRDKNRVIVPPSDLSKEEIIKLIKTLESECIVTGNFCQNENFIKNIAQLPNVNVKDCQHSIAAAAALYAEEFGYSLSLEPTYIRQPDAKPKN